MKGVCQFLVPLGQYEMVVIRSSNQEELSQQIRSQKDSDAVGGIGLLGRGILAQAAASTGKSFINIDGSDPLCRLPQVGVCDRAIGDMAAKYMAGLGFRHYAYFGLTPDGFTMGRLLGYRQSLKERGFEVHAHFHTMPLFSRDSNLVDSFLATLQSVPKPCAAFCVNDLVGGWVLNACRHCGIRVPDDMAVLGVDNSEAWCDVAFPPLSSVQLPWAEVGYRTGHLLHGLLRGEPPPRTPILLEPTSVVERMSTNALVVSDNRVKAALRYLRGNDCAEISPEAVCKIANTNRRILDREMKRHIGLTLAQEIRRLRLQHAKLLLNTTRYTLDEIACRIGISDGFYFQRFFKKETGMAPGAFRKKLHLPGTHVG